MVKKLFFILRDIWRVYLAEVRHIFGDGGVLLLFFVATLLYPFIFAAVYHYECVRDIPLAVVDESNCVESRRFTHKLDATPEINVDFRCNTMHEAEQLLRRHQVRGIVYFPRDFGTHIARLETARFALFCDMSSFLYYRSVYSGASAVLVDEMNAIEMERCQLSGLSDYEAAGQVKPIDYDDVKLFSQPGGFTSFLVPALLVLVLHQTLFLGVGVLFGTARERRILRYMPEHLRDRSLGRVALGRALAYLLIYIPLTFINLFILPRLFGLPHIGRIPDLVLFCLPFLLATIFFSISFATLFRERDAIIITCIFFSVILLFLSGAVWPQCNMPPFWRYFSYIFPSTPAIQGFLQINSMGAQLSEVGDMYHALWIQSFVYFLTTCLSLYVVRHRRRSHRLRVYREYIARRRALRR